MKIARQLLSIALGLSGLAIAASAQSTSPTVAQDPAPQQQPEMGQPQSPASQSNSAQGNNSLRIAPGSVLPVRLTKSIDAKKAKTGEQVEAKVTQDLKTGSGELVIPKDTTVVGHVTEVQAHSKEQKESQLGIAFDHAITNSGSDVPLPLSIQAIIAAPTSTSGNSDVGSPSAGPGGGGIPSGTTSGRQGGMGGTGMPVPTPSTGAPSEQSGSRSQPAINRNTQGVVGLSNLKLSAGTDSTQGSIISSEKNNVKLESGTLLLLRVNANQ